MKNQINKRHRNLCLFDLFPFKIKLNTIFCFVKIYLKFFAFYFYTCVLMEKKIIKKSQFYLQILIKIKMS